MDRNVAGSTLKEADYALFAETAEALLSGSYYNSGGALLERDAARRIAGSLARCIIRHRCACGQLDCASYYFAVPDKPRRSVRYETVRFYSRGEHMLHIDSAGDVYKAERLYDLGSGRRTLYVRSNSGWDVI